MVRKIKGEIKKITQRKKINGGIKMKFNLPPNRESGIRKCRHFWLNQKLNGNYISLRSRAIKHRVRKGHPDRGILCTGF